MSARNQLYLLRRRKAMPYAFPSLFGLALIA